MRKLNCFFIFCFVMCIALAQEESDEEYLSSQEETKTEIKEVPVKTPPQAKEAAIQKKQTRRKYFTDNTPRVDSGIFYIGIAAGGNFYIETKFDDNTGQPSGEFKDFGFQAGVYFDWDYSQLNENIPLGLRGMVGYKYITNSTHVFSFDGLVRRMWQFSESSTFGLGFGGSMAIWYRELTSQTRSEQIIFLPTLILGAGFEFSPFMVDLKALINRWSSEKIIAGFELYFGVRL